MRAVWYERIGPAADVMRVGDMDVPDPGPGEVLVRVHASGVNPHDVKKRAGASSLENTAAAHQTLQSGRVIGKVVVGVR